MNSDLDDKTILAASISMETHTCPVCGKVDTLERLRQHEYRCGQCNLELAHLDYAPNGAVRGVFGWLLGVGDVVLDRYKIKSVLGKGGFAAAYLVEDLQLSGKRWALKEVPEMMFDEYEASLLIKLNHPSIPDIIQRSSANGMSYLLLKFGGSRTLGSVRKQYSDRRVPMAKLFPWMLQLCEVLVYLHSQTPPIIHRDLKPDNILLNDDDRIMLVDFGIAKEAGLEVMTRTLGRAATHGFSPPEQVIGTGTDERSDIYALGATFYALLTGQNPPPAHERVAGAELVPPSKFVPDVPPDVEGSILQSLSLNINHRQQSVKEFALALGLVEGPTIRMPLPNADWSQTTGPIAGQSKSTNPINPASPPELKGRKPILAWVGAAAVIGLGVGIGFSLLNAPESSKAQPVTQNAKPPESPAIPAEAISPPAVNPPANIAATEEIKAEPQPPQSAEQQLVDLLPQVKQGDGNPKAYAMELDKQMDQFIPPLKGIPLSISQSGIFRENDSIKFKLNLSAAGYLHIFFFEANGKATLIFPSQYAKNNRVGPGPVNLPNGKPPIFAGPPFGKSWFMAVSESESSNLYQRYATDKTHVKGGLLELRIWEVLDYVQQRLGNPQTAVAGATIHICAKTGPCP